ncbi:hypothetical protein [Gymnodinialimonas hymeniacidonis]|uniref:hypothetical protein n=1 Tax=Gymnodinialimonas hymeniacidonis TaxID=3126508 RepID=UPI0034C5E335
MPTTGFNRKNTTQAVLQVEVLRRFPMNTLFQHPPSFARWAFTAVVAMLCLSPTNALACQSFAPIARLAAHGQTLARSNDQRELQRVAALIRSDLAQVDENRVATVLREDFPFAERDWIPRALSALETMAVAAEDGRIEDIQSVAERRFMIVALGRFALAAPRHQCATGLTTPAFPTAQVQQIGGEATSIVEEMPARETQNYSASSGRISQTAAIGGTFLLLIVLALGSFWMWRRFVRGKRSETRKLCEYPTEISTAGATGLVGWANEVLGRDEDADRSECQATRLIDFSLNGACLTQPEKEIEKDRVQFRVGDNWLSGTIKWSNQTCFGVVLDEPMTPEQIGHIRETTKKKNARSNFRFRRKEQLA